MFQPPEGDARECQAPAVRNPRERGRRSYGLDRDDARCVAWWGGWESTRADEAETVFRRATRVKHRVT